MFALPLVGEEQKANPAKPPHGVRHRPLDAIKKTISLSPKIEELVDQEFGLGIACFLRGSLGIIFRKCASAELATRRCPRPERKNGHVGQPTSASIRRASIFLASGGHNIATGNGIFLPSVSGLTAESKRNLIGVLELSSWQEALVKEFSGYKFSPLKEGDIAVYRGSGNGLAPILVVAVEDTLPGGVERLEHEYALRVSLTLTGRRDQSR